MKKIDLFYREGILEGFTDGFFTLDKSWNFTYLNKEAERMLNVKRGDVLGKFIWDCFPEAKGLKFYDWYQGVMNQQVIVKFEEHYPPLKSWFRVAAYPTSEGIVVYFQDNTQEKILEREKEKTEQNLLALINNTEDMIWSVDTDLRLLSANRAFSRSVKKRTRRNIEIGNEVLQYSIEEKEKDKWKNYYKKALNGKQYRVTEFIINPDTGEETYIETSFNPIISNENIIGVSCIARDISERKKNEDRIRHQNQMLREIAHIQSHDLRRPLATMMGLLTLFDETNLSAEFNTVIILKLKIVCQELDNIIHKIVEKTADLE